MTGAAMASSHPSHASMPLAMPAGHAWLSSCLFDIMSNPPARRRHELVRIPTHAAGIPVSTSHICIFSAVAVGCFEGLRGVNWWMVLQTFAAMFITLVGFLRVPGCFWPVPATFQPTFAYAATRCSADAH
jgi:hypothetical protein